MSDDKNPSCSLSYVCFQPMMYYQRGCREFMELNQRLLGCGLWAVTSFGEWPHKLSTLPGCVTESIWALPVLLGVPYFIGIWKSHTSQCSETQWNIQGTRRKKGCNGQVPILMQLRWTSPALLRDRMWPMTGDRLLFSRPLWKQLWGRKCTDHNS